MTIIINSQERKYPLSKGMYMLFAVWTIQFVGFTFNLLVHRGLAPIYDYSFAIMSLLNVVLLIRGVKVYDEADISRFRRNNIFCFLAWIFHFVIVFLPFLLIFLCQVILSLTL